MKLRQAMTAALGAMLLSCQGPAAVLAREAPSGEARRAATAANWEGRGAGPGMSAPRDRARETAIRLAGA